MARRGHGRLLDCRLQAWHLSSALRGHTSCLKKLILPPPFFFAMPALMPAGARLAGVPGLWRPPAPGRPRGAPPQGICRPPLVLCPRHPPDPGVRPGGLRVGCGHLAVPAAHRGPTIGPPDAFCCWNDCLLPLHATGEGPGWLTFCGSMLQAMCPTWCTVLFNAHSCRFWRRLYCTV